MGSADVALMARGSTSAAHARVEDRPDWAWLVSPTPYKAAATRYPRSAPAVDKGNTTLKKGYEGCCAGQLYQFSDMGCCGSLLYRTDELACCRHRNATVAIGMPRRGS